MTRKFLALGFLLGVLAAPAAGQDGARAFVLDSEGRAVHALDMATGRTLATVALEGEPLRMIRTADGTRLVVLDRGPGKATMRFGYHPTGKSSATVIDAAAMKALGRVELGWGLSDVDGVGAYTLVAGVPPVLGPDGKRLHVLCPGYTSQKPAETLPRELVTIDLEGATVTGRLALDRPIAALATTADVRTAVAVVSPEEVKNAAPRLAEALIVDLQGPTLAGRVTLEGEPGAPILTADGRHAVFFSAAEVPKKGPRRAAQLHFVDLASRTLASSLKLEGTPGAPFASPDGRFLYLLEAGHPSDKPDKNINGRIQVVSLETRAHETNLDAGKGPRGLIPDDAREQVLVLSDGPPSKETGSPEGELRVLRGAEVAATVKVAADPMFLRVSPDRQRLYVVGERALSHVDLPALRRVADTPLQPAGVSIMSADSGRHFVDELAITDDGRRGFALYAGSSKLTVLDLDQRKLTGSVTTGRGGKKFAKFMGAMALSVALTAASASAGKSAAIASGSPYYMYNVYNFQVRAANTSVAVRPDGKFGYALNSQTGDVTVVDADTAQVVDKIPGGGTSIRLFTGGEVLAVHDNDALRLIDTATNKKGAEILFPGAPRVLLGFSDDGRHAVAVGGAVGYALDGKTAKTVARVAGIKRAAQLIVDQPAEPPAPAAPVP